MDLDYSKESVMNIFMIKYMQNILDSFPEVIRCSRISLTVEHLFQIWDEEETKVLTENQAQICYHYMA